MLKKHFAKLSEDSVQPVTYDVVDSYESLMEKVMS
jgi:hypothetical protein